MDLNELMAGEGVSRQTLHQALFENIDWPKRVNELPPEGAWRTYVVFVLSLFYGGVRTPKGEFWEGGLALIAIPGTSASHDTGVDGDSVYGERYAHKVHNQTELGRCGLMVVPVSEVEGLNWDAPADSPKEWPAPTEPKTEKPAKGGILRGRKGGSK